MPVTLEELHAPSMLDRMEQEGITDTMLIKKLKEELEAEKTEFAKYEGDITDSKNVVAWEIRQKARQDAHKLRGDYPAEKQEVKHTFAELSDDELDAKINQLAGEIVDR